MIKLTNKAIKKIKEIAESENIDEIIIRARVLGGGCAGFKYDLYFDDKEPTDFDQQFMQDNILLVVDPLSFQYINGTKIDWIEDLMSAGFKFSNPNIGGTCGCGQSFSA